MLSGVSYCCCCCSCSGTSINRCCSKGCLVRSTKELCGAYDVVSLFSVKNFLLLLCGGFVFFSYSQSTRSLADFSIPFSPRLERIYLRFFLSSRLLMTANACVAEFFSFLRRLVFSQGKRKKNRASRVGKCGYGLGDLSRAATETSRSSRWDSRLHIST